MGNLSVYYSPVGDAPSSFGQDGYGAMHITLTYSDQNGSSFISMGPSKANDLGLAAVVGQTLIANNNMLSNTPSYWGTLRVNCE